MIKTQDLTPTVYYNQSRDFQLFGRLYDIVFNYLKTNIDLINNRKDSKLLDLLLKTLGFQSKNQYDYEDLYALSQTFIEIMRNKGTIVGIEMAVVTILRAENIKSDYSIELDEDGTVVTIYLDENINSSDVALLEEILDYILPIGLLFEIKRVEISTEGKEILGVKEATRINELRSYQTSHVSNDDTSYIDETRAPNESVGTIKPIDYKPILGDLVLGTISADMRNDSDDCNS